MNNFFDEMPTSQDIEAPEEVTNRYVPFDFDRLDREILAKTAGSAQSIKEIGGRFELAESRAIGMTMISAIPPELLNHSRPSITALQS